MIVLSERHRLRCGSAEDDLCTLMNGELADIIYANPPWGQKAFEGYNHEMGDLYGVNHHNECFMALMCGVFENGKKYLKPFGYFFIEYENHIHMFKRGFWSVVGLSRVSQVISKLAVKDGIVMDPCCGTGETAQAALQNEMRFFGNEINPKHLEDLKKCLISR